jgi:alpha-tubulin suppressor-like RCC1 family protein
LIAGAAAAALVGVMVISPGDTPADAAAPEVAAPAIQPAAAPEVIRATGTVEFEARKDRRSVDTGIDVQYDTAWVWGLGYYGISGGDAGVSDNEYNNYPPTPVKGLPRGAITEMSGQIYNFNAVDTEGCVWGWGSYAHRDGTGATKAKHPETGITIDRVGTGDSWPPVKIRIGGTWNDTSKPYLCQVTLLSATHSAGAAVTKDGYVYSWGANLYGGPDSDGSSNKFGAKLVTNLPPPNVPGNRPTQLEGGYENYWVILENGQVWYFGYSDGYERPAADEGGYELSGGVLPDVDKKRPVVAMPSRALQGWFRENNADSYVIQVHSGIYFGAALLSDGKVLTWGKDWMQAIGRGCDKNGTHKQQNCTDNQARTPNYLEAYMADPNAPTGAYIPIVVKRLSCAFTAMIALTNDGVLWGWGAEGGLYVSYEGMELYPAAFATNVESFQTGQGYVLWRKNDGKRYGIGYNPRGSVGHKASMNDSGAAGYDSIHELFFAGEEFMGCSKSEMESKTNKCNRLRLAWDGTNGPARAYQYRFTMDECMKYIDYVWFQDGQTTKAAWPWDGRKGLCA